MKSVERRSTARVFRAWAGLLLAAGLGVGEASADVAAAEARDLSPKLGALPTRNLRFDLPAHPSTAPSGPVDERLRRLQALARSTNSLAALTQELEAVLASDADASLKKEARKLALLELAHQEELAGIANPRMGHLERALQLLAEFLELHPTDALVPEVLLRQGHLCRRLGLVDRAIDRFYMVMRSANKMEAVHLDHFRRLVLMAQSEIADTEAEAGRHAEAAELYQRILRGRAEEVDVEVVLLKCLRSLSVAGDLAGMDASATRFLNEFPDSENLPEVRYLFAQGLAKAGKEQASQQQLLLLLEAVEIAPVDRQVRWAPWKFRVGNDLANQLYQRRDYTNAVRMYRSLLPAATNSAWRHPVLYQIGLCEEQLGRRPEARAAYSEIAQDPVATLPPPAKLLQDMARLRMRILQGAEASLQLKEREVVP